jgi:hypothetical protein
MMRPECHTWMEDGTIRSTFGCGSMNQRRDVQIASSAVTSDENGSVR